MTCRLGAVDAAAAEECTAQVSGAAALLSQQGEIAPCAQSPVSGKTETCQEWGSSLSRRNVDDIETPPQLRRTFHRNRSLDRAVHGAQQTNHAACYGGTRRRKAQPRPTHSIRRSRGPHTQECRQFCRLTAGTVNIRTRKCIFHI